MHIHIMDCLRKSRGDRPVTRPNTLRKYEDELKPSCALISSIERSVVCKRSIARRQHSSCRAVLGVLPSARRKIWYSADSLMPQAAATSRIEAAHDILYRGENVGKVVLTVE